MSPRHSDFALLAMHRISSPRTRTTTRPSRTMASEFASYQRAGWRALTSPRLRSRCSRLSCCSARSRRRSTFSRATFCATRCWRAASRPHANDKYAAKCVSGYFFFFSLWAVTPCRLGHRALVALTASAVLFWFSDVPRFLCVPPSCSVPNNCTHFPYSPFFQVYLNNTALSREVWTAGGDADADASAAAQDSTVKRAGSVALA
jgi:hypothetical protein